eukprot:scaffold15081_cov18-Tisochrysis_lutea.AAC.6
MGFLAPPPLGPRPHSELRRGTTDVPIVGTPCAQKCERALLGRSKMQSQPRLDRGPETWHEVEGPLGGTHTQIHTHTHVRTHKHAYHNQSSACCSHVKLANMPACRRRGCAPVARTPQQMPPQKPNKPACHLMQCACRSNTNANTTTSSAACSSPSPSPSPAGWLFAGRPPGARPPTLPRIGHRHTTTNDTPQKAMPAPHPHPHPHLLAGCLQTGHRVQDFLPCSPAQLSQRRTHKAQKKDCADS